MLVAVKAAIRAWESGLEPVGNERAGVSAKFMGHVSTYPNPW